ncbi:SCO family protein [Paenibacillus sp. CF384]|uniref:SCO family protein n=1 Tax=Paenibacillus sp. CF384 TaxID=1884382 RepID=UPI00089C1DA6|nr:SCO family protein [Paenibacillus sp. CF384]SDX68246.1 protein SCO1/2 [Paenibacillus sp. CF384]
MPIIRKYGFAIAVLALCLVMAVYLYLSSSKDAKPNLDQNLKAPSFQLTDLDGKEVTLDDSEGKVRVIYFFYANCPDICPPTTYLMTQVQDKLKENGTFGKDVEFMSITFDPKRDTAEAMRKFAGKFDIDASGWKFLREDSEEQTKQLMKDFGLGLLKDESTNLFTHTDTITFVDRKGVVRKYLTGSIDETQSPEKIVNVIDALVEE